MLLSENEMFFSDEGGLLIPENIPVEQRITTAGMFTEGRKLFSGAMLMVVRQEVLRAEG